MKFTTGLKWTLYLAAVGATGIWMYANRSVTPDPKAPRDFKGQPETPPRYKRAIQVNDAIIEVLRADHKAGTLAPSGSRRLYWAVKETREMLEDPAKYIPGRLVSYGAITVDSAPVPQDPPEWGKTVSPNTFQCVELTIHFGAENPAAPLDPKYRPISGAIVPYDGPFVQSRKLCFKPALK